MDVPNRTSPRKDLLTLKSHNGKIIVLMPNSIAAMEELIDDGTGNQTRIHLHGGGTFDVQECFDVIGVLLSIASGFDIAFMVAPSAPTGVMALDRIRDQEQAGEMLPQDIRGKRIAPGMKVRYLTYDQGRRQEETGIVHTVTNTGASIGNTFVTGDMCEVIDAPLIAPSEELVEV